MHVPSTSIETPALLLDSTRMMRNIADMQRRMDSLGVAFRPHAKTSKSPQVVQRQLEAGARGITVSTLKEAEQFFAAGVDDILYAVAIVPSKFEHAGRLIQAGLRLTLLVESAEGAQALSDFGRTRGLVLPVLVEIDTDGHRSGIAPDSPALLEVARAFSHDTRGGAELRGVLTHAGSSYGLRTDEALAALAEQERGGCVRAAERLRAAGWPCPVVSVGSTPTALRARALDGVTEVRAGVYVFFDLVMAGVGVCSVDDIALSVLCTVIGHQPEAGRLITDAGWMAMSRDRGTQKQAHDHGYGLVCDAQGQAIPQLAFNDANQEHGVLQWTGGPATDLARRFPLGSTLRIVPNHACATGAQHAAYTVPRPDGGHESWPRFNGW